MSQNQTLKVVNGKGGTHGLDGERHAGLHRPHSLVFGVVRHVRRGVEEVVDAVPAVRAYDRAAVLARDGLAVDTSNGVQSTP